MGGPALPETGLEAIVGISPRALSAFVSVNGPPGLPQFHKDLKDAQELLRKVDSDLNQKYSPDFKDRYQIELLLQELDVSDGPSEGLSLCPPRRQPQGGCVDSRGHSSCIQDQEKALDKYEHVVQGLQKRGQQVVPLKYRRETPLKPIPVEALCDFEGDQVSCCPGTPGRPGPDLFLCH